MKKEYTLEASLEMRRKFYEIVEPYSGNESIKFLISLLFDISRRQKNPTECMQQILNFINDSWEKFEKSTNAEKHV